MLKFRSRETVTAIQWQGANFAEIKAFCGIAARVKRKRDGSLWLHSIGPSSHIDIGDWLTRLPDANCVSHYPDESFKATYEPVESPEESP